MTSSLTSDLLADSVLQCVADMKLNLLNEVDRLAEELQRNLISKLSGSQSEEHVQLRVADDAAVSSQAGPAQKVRAVVRPGYDGMPGIEEQSSDTTPRQTKGGPGAEDAGAREDRALPRAPSQGFTNASATSTEVSVSSTTTPVFLQAKERQMERQRSAEQATKYGIPALPLESLHGKADPDHTPRNGNAAVQPDEPAESTEKPLLAAEAANPVDDGHDQPDIEKSGESLVRFDDEGNPEFDGEMGAVHVRSSKLWLMDTSGTSTSLRGDRQFPMVRTIVKSRIFESFFSVIIVLNCVTMGLEAEQTVKGPANDGTYYFLLFAEHSFTALFSIELVMRMMVYGWRGFIPNSGDNWWNFMDAFLVIFTGVLFSWVLPVLSKLFNFNSDSSVMRTLTTLRAARLLRLVRVVQRVPQFREAWLLLRGLTDSMRTLFWTCAVIMFITYIFAVFGLVLITKELWERRENATDPEEIQELTELLEFVGGLDLLMYTLIQLLTMDSWNGIVRRLVKQLSWCWSYFYAYIAVAVFVLMNLVTAIIVENAVTNSRQDEDQMIKQREKAKLEELKGLEHLFILMDTDGSGTLSWDEFKAAFDDPEMTRKWKLLDFDPDECKELFGLLDDGDGEIETHEFFEGLAQMKGVAQSKDVFRLRKVMDEVKDLIEALKEDEDDDGKSSKKGSPRKSPKKESEEAEGKADAKDEEDESLVKLSLQEEKCTTEFKEASVQTKAPQQVSKKGNDMAGIKAPMPPAEAEMPIVVPTHPVTANPGEKMKMKM